MGAQCKETEIDVLVALPIKQVHLLKPTVRYVCLLLGDGQHHMIFLDKFICCRSIKIGMMGPQ